MKKTKKLNEGIRVAKEGIEECWDDMGGQSMTQNNNGEQMSVTISMPGKNISVTTDSAEEIGNILRLAGINVSGTTAGDVDGDGDHDMADHAAELGIVDQQEPAVIYVGTGSEGEPSVPAQPVASDEEVVDAPDEEIKKEATDTPNTWTNSQDADEDEPDQYKNEEDTEDADEDEPDQYKNESADILRLAGVNEWSNSPEDKVDDRGSVLAELPSSPGKGAGHPDYGQNRANGQGENPMGPRSNSIEEEFAKAMGEYRKFVSENISTKKKINESKPVDKSSLEISGVDTKDHPDYSDAYFSAGKFADGTNMSDDDLEAFQNSNGSLLNQMANEYHY